ncbi:MAG: aminotransferase class I/II-fold pyridoxal phosphate-dependent enzyme, partial [Candidatus Omnitrophota bacterium]
PLRAENGFLPRLEAAPRSVLRRARILFLNYPNNPTAAVADLGFYDKVVDFARRNDIIVVQDAAYSEICFDGYRPIGFLQAKGAKDVGVEFHSLSKTYNMAGWRLGWVCGNRDVIAGLAKVKANVDSGIFSAVQLAGVAALNGPQACLAGMRALYRRRRDLLVEGLRELGWRVSKPRATFYVWAPLPRGYRSSMRFARRLLDKAGIVVTPGAGFGPSGEGYIRMALTASGERIKEAIKRMGRVIG